ncbi:MAG: aspartyl protease family protein [Woeseiaceae bacterium]|nr:aspartyl protease family protein [Woeseiaceae bacterium]
MPRLVLLVLLFAFQAEAFVSDWIPFEQVRGHITIPVTLNGIRTTAILDSGSSGNGIAKAFLIQNEGSYGYGRAINMRGVYGVQRVRLVEGIDVGIFGARMTMGELMPMSLGQHGFLVGLPFFENYIVQIDYPNNRLRIASRESMNLKKVANVKMKISKASSHPLVKVNLNDEYKTWLTLDTGNSGGIFLKRFDAERFDWLERFGYEDTLGKGVTGKVNEMDTFNLPTLELGPFELENVVVTVPDEGVETNIGRDRSNVWRRELNNTKSSGLLGYDVLRHFVVTMDFKRKLLHFEAAE